MGLFDIKKRKTNENYVKKTHFFSFYGWATESFKRFYEEYEIVKSWIGHLNNKTERIEEMHNNHKETVKRDIKETQEWIYNAFEQNKNTRKDLQKTQELIKILYQQHKETIKIIDWLKKENEKLKNIVTQNVSQSVTDSVTDSVTVTNDDITATKIESKRDVEKKEMSDTTVSQSVSQMTQNVSQNVSQTKKIRRFNDKKEIKNAIKIKEENNKNNLEEEPRIIARLNELNMSEKRVIYLLIHNEKSLNYQKIAEKLDMNYSTVKNIIYRLRKRNIPIKDEINKRGEKEFYIAENLKIALKTRK